MTKTPTIEVRAEQPYLAIPVEVALKEFDPAIAAIDEIFSWLGQRAIDPAGPLFFRYLTIGDMDGRFPIDVGVPIAAAVPSAGRIVPGVIPSGRYATLVHTGHPDRLVTAHAALQDWAAEQGLAVERDGGAWGGRFEFYLTDPAEQPDRERWSTEIAYLLRDGGGAIGAETSSTKPMGELPKGIGKPATRALAAAGYTRLDQLAAASEAELLALHGVGPKAIRVLRPALAAKGLAFAPARS